MAYGCLSEIFQEILFRYSKFIYGNKSWRSEFNMQKFMVGIMVKKLAID